MVGVARTGRLVLSSVDAGGLVLVGVGLGDMVC